MNKSNERQLVARRQITPSAGKSWSCPGHKLMAPSCSCEDGEGALRLDGGRAQGGRVGVGWAAEEQGEKS